MSNSVSHKAETVFMVVFYHHYSFKCVLMKEFDVPSIFMTPELNALPSRDSYYALSVLII